MRWWRLSDFKEKTISSVADWSTWRKIFFLMLLWCLLFIPPIVHHSFVQKDDHYHFYPSAAGPEDFVPPSWAVALEPVPLNDSAGSERLHLEVHQGEEVRFNWTWLKNPDDREHIGIVNVFYEHSSSGSGKIRLREVETTGNSEIWSAVTSFEKNGTVSYYYRVERTDIPVFYRRASIILEGGNPYEDSRTDPPPLINFFFIPPVLFAPSIEMGGAFLSFNIYFSLFVFFDSLLLYSALRHLDELKAYLAAVIFLANPVTVLTVHQDESIILFLMIIPLWLLLRSRKRFLSAGIGLGISTKIWVGFWIPVLLLLKEIDIHKRIAHILLSIITALSILIFFRTLWGPKVLWFLSYYGGTASRPNVGGISFWEFGLKLLQFEKTILPTHWVLIGIAVIEIYILWSAWRESWDPLLFLTGMTAVFLALYPKIHWEYTLLIFPPLITMAVHNKRYLFLYYAVSVFASLSMLIYMLDNGFFFVLASFIFSVMFSISLLYLTYEIHGANGQVRGSTIF